MSLEYRDIHESTNMSEHWHETANGTGNPGYVFTVIQITCYSILVVVGAVGNLLLIFSLLLKRHRKTSEYFILNLATVDLLSCSLSVPFDIILIAIGGWPFGSFMCKIVYPLQTVFMAVSVATLLCMALERYRAILHPLKPKIKGRVITGGIIATWLISLVLVSPYAISLKSEDGNCVEKWPNDDPNYPKSFTLCVFLFLYVSPLCIITVAYAAVGKRLRADTKKAELLFGQQHCGDAAKIRAKRNVKVVKIFVFAVVAFAFCLLPFQVMWMWSDFGNGQNWEHFDIALTFANVMVYTNSAMNPFIFGALGRRYPKSKCCYRNKDPTHRLESRRFLLFRLDTKSNGTFATGTNAGNRTGVEQRGASLERKHLSRNSNKKQLRKNKSFYKAIRETLV